MWEQQLQSMLEANHLDHETWCDLAVAYAAEMRDDSLFGTVLSLQQLLIGRRVIRTYSESGCSYWLDKCYSTSSGRGTLLSGITISISGSRTRSMRSSLSSGTNSSISDSRVEPGILRFLL